MGDYPKDGESRDAKYALVGANEGILESLLAYLKSRAHCPPSLASLIGLGCGDMTQTYGILSMVAYEKVVEMIHMNTAGEDVDPFVSLEDREARTKGIGGGSRA